MLSRRAAKAIADAYRTCFTHTARRYSGAARRSTLTFNFYRDQLYDFLYVHDMRPWLLNRLRRISASSKRGLLEFLMRLHTGESTVAATDGWPWDRRRLLGQQILLEMAEALIRERLHDPDFGKYRETKIRAVDEMRRALELEGYVFQDGTLRFPEESPIDEEEEQGVLEQLAASLGLEDLDTLKHHLQLAGDQYVSERWEDSISNSRKVLEWVLSAAARKYAKSEPPSGASLPDLTRPAVVRAYLADTGLLEKKERDAIAKTYGLLSETGAHPYVAEQDQARLMRHLALTFSQFVLLRLQGALKEER